VQAEQRFAVMGTTAHVLVVGDDAGDHVDAARASLDALERKWSRFLPSSEISRMNALSGEHVVVSPETVLLVQCAVEGWRRSGGWFDPTVLPALRALGYDRDFARVRAGAHRAAQPAHRAPGCAAIHCDPGVSSVTLPRGVEFDAGGIGKGLAADLVSAQLIDAGARGALVNVGGDLRVRGDGPADGAWRVGVVDPARAEREVVRVHLHDGAVATSSRARRRWATPDGPVHHLVDPTSGRSANGTHATVTAVTGDAWWAEVVAKTVLVGDLAVHAGARFGAHVVTIAADGAVAADPALLEHAA
jgi:thiamine biosynthesis lipoprotein